MTERMRENRRDSLVRVGVISADGVLLRKLELALSGIAELKSATIGSELGFDLVLRDMRERTAAPLADVAEGGARAGVYASADRLRGSGNNSDSEGTACGRRADIVDREVWEGDGASLPYPFAFRELRELVLGSEASAARLIIEDDGRHIMLDGIRIRLTEREHALLSAIADGRGEFVGRDELRERAFGPDAEGGILNVYIHYLREKLEGGGEKIILSSRLGGYRIDEKYLGVNK